MSYQDVLTLTSNNQNARWNVATPTGTPTFVTFSFGNSKASYDTTSNSGFTAWTEAHKVHVRQALSVWADASGLTFLEVADSELGQVRFSIIDMAGQLNSSGNEIGGYGYYPSYRTSSSTGPANRYDTIGGDVFINELYYASSGSTLAPGSGGFSLLLHEIGHAIGFKHPFDGSPVIEPAHDNGAYTIMSYNTSQSQTTLGTVDIEAAQYYYGAASFGYDWDPSALRLTVYGTNGDDTQLGTELNDVIFGFHGNDILRGGPGSDHLLGGYGNDMFYGDDVFSAAQGDTLDGGPGSDTAVYTAFRSSSSINHSTNGYVTVTTAGVTDALRGVEWLQFRDIKVWIGERPTVKDADFNNDGYGDILYRHESGLTHIYMSNGPASFSGVAIGSIDTGWKVEGSGDFNGDGRSDILWRYSSGQTHFWLMNADGSQVGVNSAAPGNDWHIQGTGDFNGDGRSDILWRHDGGSLSIWNMNGDGSYNALSPAAPGNDWQIQQIADFNGDNRDDILWRNTAGSTAIWNMNPDGSHHDVAPGSAGSDWQIDASGDFNGDGRADILWRNESGFTYIWKMNANGTHQDFSPGSAEINWQIQNTADYNGDGRDDIMWRYTSGQTFIWNMNANGTFNAVDGGAPGSDWVIA